MAVVLEHPCRSARALDLVELEALLRAIDDRVDVAPADDAGALARARAMLELELSDRVAELRRRSRAAA